MGPEEVEEKPKSQSELWEEEREDAILGHTKQTEEESPEEGEGEKT